MTQFTRGKDSDIQDCLAIAKGLPGYFRESAIANMAGDLVGEEFFVTRDAHDG